MIIETRSAQETYELGLKIGKEAKKGQVYTMVGDLGVGKTVFTQGMAHGLGIKEPAVRHLPLCRYMMMAECRFIISMCIELVISQRWMRSVMKTIFMEKASH